MLQKIPCIREGISKKVLVTNHLEIGFVCISVKPLKITASCVHKIKLLSVKIQNTLYQAKQEHTLFFE